MGNSNGVISAPINVTGDVAKVLRRNTVDIGQLCGDVKAVVDHFDATTGDPVYRYDRVYAINKWAKYKPTRMHGPNPTDWYKGELKTLAGQPTNQEYSYGLSMVQHTGLYGSSACLKEQMDANNLGWEYEPPRGIATQAGEFFRVLDFNGYYANAVSPFNGYSDSEVQAEVSYNIYLYVDFSASDARSLGLSDFEMFDNWYFGIALWKGNTFCGAGTSSETLGNASNNSRKVDFTLPSYAIGNCTMYPFFTPVQKNWSTSNPFASTTKFVALPTGVYALKVITGDPWRNLQFTLASGGSINLNRLLTHAQITTSFPALYAVNTASGSVSVNKSRLHYSVYLQKINDSSLRYETAKYSMGLSGTVSVGTTSTQIFPSVSGLSLTDTAARDFVNNNGGDISEWALSAIIYEQYSDTFGETNYYYVATMSI